MTLPLIKVVNYVGASIQNEESIENRHFKKYHKYRIYLAVCDCTVTYNFNLVAFTVYVCVACKKI